ncbi:STAS domain-containing protein [Chloroflexia bacterium SDU3-3]|nr:STAS domain-containing protein [Chloroflexia bacterium SDU3-3]
MARNTRHTSITKRQAILTLFTLLFAATTMFFLITLIFPNDRIALAIVGVTWIIVASLFASYYRGWDTARFLVPPAIVIAFSMTDSAPYTLENLIVPISLIPILTLIFANWIWTVGIVVTLFAIMVVRGGGAPIAEGVLSIPMYAAQLGLVALVWHLSSAHARQAEQSALLADEARQQAEHERQQAEQHRDDLTRQNQEQQRLIQLIDELETPAIAVAEGVLIAPLVGNIDSRRGQQITKHLLDEVYRQQIELVILDITGVRAMDTIVTRHLVQTSQSLQLLGCQVILSGISTELAISITQMGIELNQRIQTARTPKAALEQFFQQKDATDELGGNAIIARLFQQS